MVKNRNKTVEAKTLLANTIIITTIIGSTVEAYCGNDDGIGSCMSRDTGKG